MIRDQTMMCETFYLSNMCPQNLGFNRGIWQTLEGKARDWAKNRRSIWVISGLMCNKTGGCDTIDPNKVQVPNYFYKIIVSEPEPCKFDTIAFLIPNEAGISSTRLPEFITSIDYIEQETGLDFFDVLDDNLEEQIESQTAQGLWSA